MIYERELLICRLSREDEGLSLMSHVSFDTPFDAIVIGGGPAGTAAGRLLAS